MPAITALALVAVIAVAALVVPDAAVHPPTGRRGDCSAEEPAAHLVSGRCACDVQALILEHHDQNQD